MGKSKSKLIQYNGRASGFEKVKLPYQQNSLAMDSPYYAPTQDCQEKFIPVCHINVPRYALYWTDGNNLIQIGLVWCLHTLFDDPRESFTLSTLKGGLYPHALFYLQLPYRTLEDFAEKY